MRSRARVPRIFAPALLSSCAVRPKAGQPPADLDMVYHFYMLEVLRMAIDGEAFAAAKAQ